VVVRRLHSGHPCLSLPSVFTYKYRGGEHKSGTHKKERVDRPKEKKYPKRKKEEKKEEKKQRRSCHQHRHRWPSLTTEAAFHFSR